MFIIHILFPRRSVFDRANFGLFARYNVIHQILLLKQIIIEILKFYELSANAFLIYDIISSSKAESIVFVAFDLLRLELTQTNYTQIYTYRLEAKKIYNYQVKNK